MACRSELLRSLHWNECPRVEDMTDPKFLPFVACYSQSSPAVDNGVIILRNIPYETTRSECIAMLGRNSRLLSDVYEPVHIIMDRVTSKTLDAFCEVDSLHAALNLAAKFGGKEENGRQENSRHARLGNRTVEVEVSSQASLMQALFPNAARGVQWHGAQPQPTLNAKDPWDNFKGFVTEEEMSMLAKHVEVPQRSTFSRACPERPYECMISTLRKMPWYKAQYITIKQRQSVYEACMKMIAVLDNKLNPREGFPVTERLTRQLFNRLVNSAMLCPGFSVVQKHNIAVLARLSEDKVRGFNQPRFPDSWRHQWTLIPKPGMPIDLLEWYIAVIRTETNRVVQNLDISQKMPLQQLMERVDGYWGYFWAEANFPVGPDFDNMSLEECNAIEWRAIGAILTRAVKGGAIPPSYTIGSNHLDSSAPRQIGY
ncbi:hypothetical protein GGS20DRAFT_594425 [Poronia punctata]|nr:hypothetical protein GGS20DRAFT_594425 [Poronia punctata]